MKATETTVLNFIGGLDKVFIIPPFQRNYEWSIEQCEELFNDIVRTYKNDKTHYLGNVVYYKGKNDGASYSEYILVDGQQRVTTILLLLCALRDSLPIDDDNIRSINNRYLLNDTGDNRFRIRLKQTSYDTNSFMSIIDNIPIENSDNNVFKNYKFFLKLIDESNINPAELYKTIPKLEVVDVNLQIENDLNAVQTIFEKINSTGKRLTPADLIRNYLLLSDNSEEQERLYETYWVKIEQTIKNDNISRFARDFLIMNIFDDVPEAKIYKMFKDHFDISGAAHIDILSDMYKFSRYFGWLKHENCPNNKVNRIIKTLNYVNSDDLYPLYLYLFDTKYESNTLELIKIITLISDFMLRYRVVSPSGGGGALRSVIQQLLEGLNSGVIENNYNAIHFELSNSNTPSGRFPSDEEFKAALCESVNIKNAKITLMKIEEQERHNIPIALDLITVEHVMPQTLSDAWVKYLGGRENAERIHDEYLNCIGNLTPISQNYNSKISNKIWSEKKVHIRDVQFGITSKIADNDDWKEDNIKARNENIALRACVAITSPLERTRKYQTKNVTSEFESGVYPISDTETPMSGTILECILYDGETIEVSTWKDFLCEICTIALIHDSDLFADIVLQNKIHKATSKTNYPEKDPIISKKPTLLGESKQILNSDYFSEGCISSNRARVYAKQLSDLFGITDRIQISVRDR